MARKLDGFDGEINTQVDKLDDVVETVSKPSGMSKMELGAIKVRIPEVRSPLDKINDVSETAYSYTNWQGFTAWIDMDTHMPIIAEGYFWKTAPYKFMGEGWYKVFLMKETFGGKGFPKKVDAETLRLDSGRKLVAELRSTANFLLARNPIAKPPKKDESFYPLGRIYTSRRYPDG